MEIVDVPEVEPYAPTSPPEYNGVDFADMVLTCLMKRDTAFIHAEYRLDNPSVTWFISQQQGMDEESYEPVAVSSSRGEFRNALARFGHHYMDGQLYGGFSARFFRQHGSVYRCLIYMSNSGLSGFWIRIYGAASNDGS
jgi:hypothetical protein